MIDNFYRYEAFSELTEMMKDKKLWDEHKFIIFPYESGLGKSMHVRQLIAESDKRILYVQRFVKDEALKKTADTINKKTCNFDAVAFSSDNKSVMKISDLKEKRVLCITHRMYLEICRGRHKELLENRDILIIDEFPDTFEMIQLSNFQICQLYACNNKYPDVKQMVDYFSSELNKNGREIIKEIDIDEIRKEEFINLLKKILKENNNIKEIKDIINNFILLLNEDKLFQNQNKLINSNTKLDFKMLKCNIILDASAEIDKRYSNHSLFKIKKQAKVLDYSDSQFNWYEVSTSKQSISQYDNFNSQVLNSIDFKENEEVLFITEKSNKKYLQQAIKMRIKNKSLNISGKSEVDYFGNLIGKNDYKDKTTVVVLNTPNFELSQYAIMYSFYNSNENLSELSTTLSQVPAEFLDFKDSIIATEIYQAIRRIARNAPSQATYHVFTSNKRAIEYVVSQLPKTNVHQINNIVFKVKQKYEIEGKSTYGQKSEKVKNFILDTLNNKSTAIITKKEIKSEFSSIDASNLNKILNRIKSDIENEGIIIEEKNKSYRKNTLSSETE